MMIEYFMMKILIVLHQSKELSASKLVDNVKNKQDQINVKMDVLEKMFPTSADQNMFELMFAQKKK